MEVFWSKETPVVSDRTKLSKMLVVRTNLGYLNIGIYSEFFKDWICFAPMASTETITEWLDVSEVKCTQ